MDVCQSGEDTAPILPGWRSSPVRNRDFGEALEEGAMAIDVQTQVHRVDAEMRGACLLPGGDIALPVLLAGAEGVDPGVNADLVWIAARCVGRVAQQLQFGAVGIVDRTHREPAVADPGGALDRDLGRAADPDRDRSLDRERVQS